MDDKKVEELLVAGGREPEEYEWAEFNLPREMLGSQERDRDDRAPALQAPARDD